MCALYSDSSAVVFVMITRRLSDNVLLCVIKVFLLFSGCVFREKGFVYKREQLIQKKTICLQARTNRSSRQLMRQQLITMCGVYQSLDHQYLSSGLAGEAPQRVTCVLCQVNHLQ